ncbi:hypothetical protein ADK65_18715 [Streptomyces sp. NRRL B-1140]|uniref:hypothetical protein n=1 Tax=Streptomyces sp. NRRL B-1140 TaxID=1415549 RepID=UPI0006AEF1AC|nr:hypothetical protein [Streptomyces sp. NRRL B-1140]KOV99244.1 hypothetical protein ADK65_18715 [Streptomyces sp. NRRL B-1140]
MNAEDSAQEPPEHARFAAHLADLEQVTGADEEELVAGVLADPDPAMAGAAVVRHLDRRAEELYAASGWEEWAEAMARVVGGRPFLVRRLREWALFRAVALELPWEEDDLLASSDWLQLRTAAGAGPGALVVLAERGRTKRIRGTARAGLTRGNPA